MVRRRTIKIQRKIQRKMSLKNDSLIFKFIERPIPKENFFCSERLGIGHSISIITLNQCNLHCSFCRGGVDQEKLKEYSRFKTMSMIEFESIVNKCVESGIKFYDLTPAIGEPLIDKTFINKLKTLESTESCIEYTFTTNLLLMTLEDIQELKKLKKLVMDISIYGSDSDQFLKNTNRDGYEKFMSKLEELYDNCGDMKIRFIQRCDIKSSSNLMNYIKSFLYNKNANFVTSEIYNLNRGGNIENESSVRQRNGICPYGPGAGGGIVSGGNVLFCPFHDMKREGVVGNVFETPLSEIYNGEKFNDILTSQKNNVYKGMCKSCDETW